MRTISTGQGRFRGGWAVAGAMGLVIAAGSATALGQSASDQAQSFRAELLGDASTRASAQGGAASGPTIGGAVQFRYVLHNAERNTPPGSEDLTTGFQTRLTTIWITGNVGDRFGYRVQGNYDASGGAFILEDAFVTYKWSDQLTLAFGQQIFPIIWEDFVIVWNRLATDLSPTGNTFTPDRVQAAWFLWQGDDVRFFGAFSDGANTDNTDIDSPVEADYAFTGRFEYKWAGKWDQFDDMTSFQGSQYAGKVGAAVHWQSGGETSFTVDQEILLATIDAVAEGDGWNAMIAGIYRTIDPAVGSSLDDVGVLVQGGIFVDPRWEIFGRYDITIPDDSRPGDPDDFSAVTVGANHYFIERSHAAKFTLELGFFIDEQARSIVPASTNSGPLAADKDGQFRVVAQLQFIY